MTTRGEAEIAMREAQAEIDEVVKIYKERLETGDLSEKEFAQVTDFLQRLPKQPDLYIENLSGPEFGGSQEAYRLGHKVHKNHLPLAARIGAALTKRTKARQILAKNQSRY